MVVHVIVTEIATVIARRLAIVRADTEDHNEDAFSARMANNETFGGMLTYRIMRRSS